MIGRVGTGITDSFTYDVFGRLTSANVGNNRVEYEYDYRGLKTVVPNMGFYGLKFYFQQLNDTRNLGIFEIFRPSLEDSFAIGAYMGYLITADNVGGNIWSGIRGSVGS